MTKHAVKPEPIQAHPAANVPPMMSEEELARLVADISANGLNYPITVGVVGEQRWIVDGRNREKACALAGVAPEYEEVAFKDEAALIAFVIGSNERRDVTKSQRAMLYAMWAPMAENKGRPKKGEENGSATKPFSKALLSQARAVLAHSPDLADKVRNGFPLSEAFEVADLARKMTQADDSLKARLTEEAPDLLALVDEGKMKLREAVGALDARLKEQEDHKKVATANLVRGVTVFMPRGASPTAYDKSMFKHVDKKYWPTDMPPFSKEIFLECAAVLEAFVRRNFPT